MSDDDDAFVTMTENDRQVGKQVIEAIQQYCDAEYKDGSIGESSERKVRAYIIAMAVLINFAMEGEEEHDELIVGELRHHLAMSRLLVGHSEGEAH